MHSIRRRFAQANSGVRFSMKSLNDVDEAVVRWALEENLRELIWYYNAVRNLLKQEYTKPEIATNERAKNSLLRCDTLNSASCFLVMFGYLEEMLLVLHRTAAPLVQIDTRRGALERFRPVFTFLGKEAGRLPCWSSLVDAGVIRNCLMHANGKVSSMSNAEDVKACISRSKKGLLLQNGRVALTPIYLSKFIGSVRQLRDAVLGT
jgi:hypothetical protein